MSNTINITFNNGDRKLNIVWPDGEHNDFHYVWLRHNARCPDGKLNDTDVKIDLLPDDPKTLSIKDINSVDQVLTINWQDDHLQTTHNLSVLRAMAYEKSTRRNRKHIPILWDASKAQNIPSFQFDSLNDETNLLELFLAIRDYGLVKLTNVPTKPGTVKSLAKHFGTVVVNNYGEVFDVKTTVNVELGSNTGVYLGPHTDEGYRHAPPGISLFHCLESTSQGGASILVDGFNAAQQLRNTDPEAFKTLTTIPVYFQRLSIPQEDMRTHARVIATDLDGDVIGIRFSDRTIPPQDLPDKHVEPIYQAIKAFWNIINTTQLKYEYLMQPGDLHIFDNHRVLHGRTAFDSATCVRHLQQCSVNRDEFHSNLRTLAIKHNHPAYNLMMTEGAFS